MIAQFRATHDLSASDPAFLALTAHLRSRSAPFAAWWAAHDIRATASGRKCLHHPLRGPRWYEYTTFQSNDDPALKVAVYLEVEVAAPRREG